MVLEGQVGALLRDKVVIVGKQAESDLQATRPVAHVLERQQQEPRGSWMCTSPGRLRRDSSRARRPQRGSRPGAPKPWRSCARYRLGDDPGSVPGLVDDSGWSSRSRSQPRRRAGTTVARRRLGRMTHVHQGRACAAPAPHTSSSALISEAAAGPLAEVLDVGAALHRAPAGSRHRARRRHSPSARWTSRAARTPRRGSRLRPCPCTPQ